MKIYLDNCCFNRPYDDLQMLNPVDFIRRLEEDLNGQ